MRGTLIAAMAALIMLAACATAPHDGRRPVVLFDQSHGELFRIERNERLDLGTLAGVFVSEGYTVRGTYGALTAERLAEPDVLVMSGPMNTPSEAETANVDAFLNRGGTLVVMLHVAPSVSGLLEHLGVKATRAPITETGPAALGGDARNFRAVSLAAGHPLFKGIGGFGLYGVWGLTPARPDAVIIANTSAGAFVDENNNGKPDAGEPHGPIGLVAEGHMGKGRYLVFGDDAVFQNAFITGDNLKLAHNLARWGSQTPSP